MAPAITLLPRSRSTKTSPLCVCHLTLPNNPIENDWEYLRGNKLAITVFDDYDDIVDKTCGAWNFFNKIQSASPQSPPEHG
jgi:hypothetical protein